MSLNMGLQVQVYVCVVSCRYVGLYMSVCICMQEQEDVCMVVGCVYAQVCVCTDICGKYMNKCVCVHACIQVHTVTAPSEKHQGQVPCMSLQDQHLEGLVGMNKCTEPR